MSEPELMRVRIEVDPNWKVSATYTPSGGKAEISLFERQMQKYPDERGGFFPGPPADQMTEPRVANCPLCTGNVAELWKAYNSLQLRQPEPAPHFGAYLFESLIGSQNWKEKLLPAVQAAGLVELALAWEETEVNLHRLNWEMMAEGGSFLVVHPSKKVTFTRVVKNTHELQAVSIAAPPRILFVAGTTLTDPSIRPGAEYLGLIRQVASKTGPTMRSHLIYEATVALLKKTVEWFHPDIVHFICHGNVDSKGQSYLLMQDEQKGKLKAVYADQLSGAIQVGGKTPPVVVLSACYTGSAGVVLGGKDAAPLAAQLVKSGVPVVVAMAGRVSDAACRLFTRRCGEALVEGKPLILATALGRRAAHLEGSSMRKSVDWAFPSVYMAESVASDYRPVSPSAVELAKKIEGRLNHYRLPSTPVFCGREDFLQAYYSLFEEGGPAVLACYSINVPGYGKTRLLEEFTARALREGRAPCLVKFAAGEDPPKNPQRLGLKILRAIDLTRRALGLEPPLKSRLLMRLLIQPPPNLAQLEPLQTVEPDLYLSSLIEYYESSNSELKGSSAGEAVRADLTQLARQAQLPVVLLLDDVHLYDSAIFPLLNEWLNGNGLGDEENPVPVVLTFSENTPADHYLKRFRESGYSWLKEKAINPFNPQSEDELMGEDILAYQRIFLNPFTELLQPLAANPGANETLVKKHVSRLRREIKGLPYMLKSPEMRLLGEWGEETEVLVSANDEEIEQQMKKAGLT